jgi:hypothetical protein
MSENKVVSYLYLLKLYWKIMKSALKSKSLFYCSALKTSEKNKRNQWFECGAWGGMFEPNQVFDIAEN